MGVKRTLLAMLAWTPLFGRYEDVRSDVVRTVTGLNAALTNDAPMDVAPAIQAGASGALVKDASNEELLSAIRTVAAGGQAFSREIKTQLEKEPVPPELTKRQLEILTSIVNGQASDAIALRKHLLKI